MRQASSEHSLPDAYKDPRLGHDNVERAYAALGWTSVLLLSFVAFAGVKAHAQASKVILERNGNSIGIELYAPNIFRVTLGNNKAAATGAPGYGLTGTPSMDGWTHKQEGDGDEVFRSNRLVVHLSADHLPESRLPTPCRSIH